MALSDVFLTSYRKWSPLFLPLLFLSDSDEMLGLFTSGLLSSLVPPKMRRSERFSSGRNTCPNKERDGFRGQRRLWQTFYGLKDGKFSPRGNPRIRRSGRDWGTPRARELSRKSRCFIDCFRPTRLLMLHALLLLLLSLPRKAIAPFFLIAPHFLRFDSRFLRGPRELIISVPSTIRKSKAQLDRPQDRSFNIH